MSTTNSPNMALPVPGVGNELGPNYANDINACMSIIDAHTHTSGNGVQITPAGLNISTDLPFGNNNATGVRSVRLQDQSGAISGGSDLSCVYNNGGNLYFNDSAGNQIAITANGGIAGSPGSIANLVSPASATYTAGSKLFTWASGTSGKAAAMDNGAVTIRQTDTASAKGITLASPNALASDYALTLPTALPGSTQYLNCDASGNLGTSTPDAIAAAMTSTGANSIATTMNATGANTIAASRTRATGTTVAAGGVAISASSGISFSASNSFFDITNMTVTITTSGRPVMITFIPDGTTNPAYVFGEDVSAGFFNIHYKILRGASAVAFFEHFGSNAGTTLQPAGGIPPGSFVFIDAVAAGTYTYKIQGDAVSGGWVWNYIKMIAYEL